MKKVLVLLCMIGIASVSLLLVGKPYEYIPLLPRGTQIRKQCEGWFVYGDIKEACDTIEDLYVTEARALSFIETGYKQEFPTDEFFSKKEQMYKAFTTLDISKNDGIEEVFPLYCKMIIRDLDRYAKYYVKNQK